MKPMQREVLILGSNGSAFRVDGHLLFSFSMLAIFTSFRIRPISVFSFS